MAKLPCQNLTASGTSLIVQTVCLGTGLMPKGFGGAIRVGVAATAAGVGGIAILGTSGIGDDCLVIVANGIRATSELDSLVANRADSRIDALSFARRIHIRCPIARLMNTARRLDACGTAAACRRFCSGLNTLALRTLVVVHAVAFVSEENVENALDQNLQPPLRGKLLLIIVGFQRQDLGHLMSAIPAGIQLFALRSTSGFLVDCTDVIVSDGRSRLGIRITASRAGVYGRTVFGASRRRFRHDRIRMSQGFHGIRGKPLAADPADMLVVTLLGAGGSHPNGRIVFVTVSVVDAIQHEGVIPADRHALGVSHPAVCGIAHLVLNLRRQDDGAKGQDNLGNEGHAVGVKEPDCVLAGAGLDDGARHDILRGRGRNTVGNAVTVDIPAHQSLEFLKSLGKLQIGLADDLRGQEDLAAHEVAVLIVEISRDPIVAVDHLVAVTPAGEVFIPADVLLVGFRINGHTGDAKECPIIHTDVFRQNNGFEGEGNTIGTSTEILV